MSISDTLDQLTRALVAPSSSDNLSGGGGSNPLPAGIPAQGAEPGDRPEPPVADLGALVAEVALKRAHELDRSGAARVDRLETSAGAVENLGLGFHLGAAMERIAVAAGEGSEGAPRLREAAWLIARYITLLEARPIGADIHASSNRLARTGGTIGADVQEIASELEPAPEPDDAEPAPPAIGIPSPAPAQIVNELPSIGRELFVTAARAAIAVAAITVVVFLLTLIAQWR